MKTRSKECNKQLSKYMNSVSQKHWTATINMTCTTSLHQFATL